MDKERNYDREYVNGLKLRNFGLFTLGVAATLIGILQLVAGVAAIVHGIYILTPVFAVSIPAFASARKSFIAIQTSHNPQANPKKAK